MEILELIIGLCRVIYGIRKRLTVLRITVFTIVAGGLSRSEEHTSELQSH